MDPKQNRMQPIDVDFRSGEFLTLGVEVEAQLIDWRNQELCPAATRILPLCQGENITAEIFQSMIEISTGICRSLAEVDRDLSRARAALLAACESVGVEVVGAGTHPFSRRGERLIFPAPRYRTLIDRNQWIARRLTIFGLHVHIGARSGDHAMQLANGLMAHLGTLLALSASSPYIEGHFTGLHSARSTVFESQPTAGSPPSFADWQSFTDHVERLTRCEAIESLKDLWWDIRPNPSYGTVEIRICDGTARPCETLALVALIQCLAAWIDEQIAVGCPPPAPALWRLRENKWRAARWGMEANLILDDEGRWAPMREVVQDLLDRLKPWARKLNCQEYLLPLQLVFEDRGSVHRQRRIYQQTRSLQAVVQALAREWRSDEIVEHL